MIWDVVSKTLTAFYTLELIVLSIDVSGANLKFKVPVLTKNEGIAYGYAGTYPPTFKTIVGKRR